MYAVPWEYKNYKGIEKGLLRYAMKDILPYDVLWRKKSPYPKTHDPKYMNLVSDALRELLLRKDAPIMQLVNKQELENLLSAQYTWPW
jgi:asparagine synthase (glutamine-hydrolysing)